VPVVVAPPLGSGHGVSRPCRVARFRRRVMAGTASSAQIIRAVARSMGLPSRSRTS